MLDTLYSSTRSASRAKPCSSPKPAGAAPTHATALVKALLGLGGLSDAAVAATWGRDRRGLIPLALSVGFNFLFPTVGLIRREGRLVGFAAGGAAQALDYSDPGSIHRGHAILQPSNLNLARRTRGSPEETLARVLRYPDQKAWDKIAGRILGVAVDLKRSRASPIAPPRGSPPPSSPRRSRTKRRSRQVLGALAVALSSLPSLRPSSRSRLSTRPQTPTGSATPTTNSRCSSLCPPRRQGGLPARRSAMRCC